MIRRILCRIGLHGYHLVGFCGLMLADWFEVCDTCGKGRLWVAYGQARMYYTPEQVRTILANRCTPNAPPRSSPGRPS